MKTYNEILQEITRAKARAEKATAAAEKYADEIHANFESWRGGLFDTPAELKQANARIQDAASKESEKATRAKIEIEILKDNAARVLYADAIGKICEIWNSYAGKQYGEKTSDKIRAEIESATGLRVWFKAYPYAEISINTTDRGSLFWNYCDTLNAWNKDGEKLLNSENRVQAITADLFRLSRVGEYVDDVKKHAAEIMKAHAAAMRAEKEFKTACENYNAMTRGKINRANPREGVKTWFF